MCASMQAHTHTHKAHYTKIIACRKDMQNMNDKEFLNFINAQSTKNVAKFNLLSCNVSKKAVAILADTPYKALAKAHVNANVRDAYYNNADFADKLQAVMNQYDIILVA